MAKLEKFAFPANNHNYDSGLRGMTLRDYFAAKAITTLVRFSNDKCYENEAAEAAYRYADAMMKAREA